VRADSLDRRPVRAGDVDALHAILGHAEVSRWLRPAGVTTAISREECRGWAERDAAHWVAHGFGSWLILRGEVPVAHGGLRHTLAGGRSEVEIGWAVAREQWGTGVATAIGRWSLAAASEAGIDRVIALTRADNSASRRVMEKIGLRYERELVHAGLPHVLYRNSRPKT
jgi:RimJ/RimL family protein N-acetyltransferase